MERFCVIPQPAEFKRGEGRVALTSACFCEQGRFLPAAEALSDAVDRLLGHSLESGEGGVYFRADPGLRKGEYAIEVTKDGCTALCGGDEGALYAAATLAQLFRMEHGSLTLPLGSLRDWPEYEWRGLMVDLARNWHPVRYLFKYVDLCWLYKINRLQLHFTDDQSYTLPSRAFPALPTQGRHYTFAELSALEEYALRRGVTLVPEMDFPGHSGEFNRKYPQIFGGDGIMCCEEKTFQAIELLLKELCQIFPNSPYIHIGGDEAQIAKWDDCPGCVEYRKTNGLSDVHAQYAHYVDRLARMVMGLGRRPVAWEGFAKEYNHMVTKELLMFSWENYYQPAPDLAEGGFTLINASWKPNYVCTSGKMWSREEILWWNPRRWTHWWPKSQAYNTTLTVPDSAPVLGGQMCAWGDHLVGSESKYEASDQELARLQERLPALAQRTWQSQAEPAENAIWDEAEKRAVRLLR